jgi:hypothetical protein
VEDLATACRDAQALADLLEYAAGLLRGRPADPEGPPLDAVPGSVQVLAVLARRERAVDDAERAWEGLAASVRDGLQPPGELLEKAGVRRAPPLHAGCWTAS